LTVAEKEPVGTIVHVPFALKSRAPSELKFQVDFPLTDGVIENDLTTAAGGAPPVIAFAMVKLLLFFALDLSVEVFLVVTLDADSARRVMFNPKFQFRI
jgi:hypothetical protein